MLEVFQSVKHLKLFMQKNVEYYLNIFQLTIFNMKL